MGEITKVRSALPATKSVGKTGLAEINETLAAFVQPLQFAARVKDEWECEGRTIGGVYFDGRANLGYARPIHRAWLPKYAALWDADLALHSVLRPRSEKRIDSASALRMVTHLFAALGMKKNDQENAMLLASAAEMFSPIDGLIGNATGLWKPISTHPLVLALAIKRLIATAKFTSCAELREAMEKARHSIEIAHWRVDYLTSIIMQADEIMFEHDRPAWEANYANVPRAVLEQMLPHDESGGYCDDNGNEIPPTARWTAINKMLEQHAERKIAACEAPPLRKTRKPSSNG